ncbi:MAG: hypothetical protein RLZZ429_2215 [Bacteroidota bacterium]
MNSIKNEEEDFSFRMLLDNWWNSFLHALRSWKLISVGVLVGVLLGLAYAYIKKPVYTARISFVVEESKSGGGNLASALAGQFGFDMSNIAGSGGVLAGDNVLELLKSRSLLRKTLLTGYPEAPASQSLADLYANVYRLKEKWADDEKIGKTVMFKTGQTKLPRLEDSLLQIITERILKKELSIAKPEKKLSFFELELTTRSEPLSVLICERLLKTATDFYIQTKTSRIRTNVERLQRRADSLAYRLDQKTASAANTGLRLIDINPAYTSPLIDAEIKSRDKYIQSTVYAEIIANLEASKTALIQETPTIQIVDQPELPLKKQKVKWYWSMLAGAMIAFVVSVYLLSFRKWK